MELEKCKVADMDIEEFAKQLSEEGWEVLVMREKTQQASKEPAPMTPNTAKPEPPTPTINTKPTSNAMPPLPVKVESNRTIEFIRMAKEALVNGDCEKALLYIDLAERREKGREVMTSRQAAAFLGCSMTSLAMWRCEGRGPKYSKGAGGRNSRVSYRRSDLEEWNNKR